MPRTILAISSRRMSAIGIARYRSAAAFHAASAPAVAGDVSDAARGRNNGTHGTRTRVSDSSSLHVALSAMWHPRVARSTLSVAWSAGADRADTARPAG